MARDDALWDVGYWDECYWDLVGGGAGPASTPSGGGALWRRRRRRKRWEDPDEWFLREHRDDLELLAYFLMLKQKVREVTCQSL